jgi:hypothetical protein
MYTIAELQLLRQSLDMIAIQGKDAKAIANLQIKLESNILSIEETSQETQLEED